jgi:hypothetical protein
MKKKMVFMVSLILTAFTAVIGIGVVKAIQETETTSVPVIDAALEKQIVEREAAYQELITEANKRIEVLNSRIEEVSSVEPTQAGISPEEAALTALQISKYQSALMGLPELVIFEDRTAYEVELTDGIMYIDFLSGELLFNNVPERVNEEQAAQIAAEFLGGMDPRYAQVKLTLLDETKIFQVSLNGYIVYLDQFGTILRAQAIQYNEVQTASNSGSVQQTSNNQDDDSKEHEEHDEEDDDEWEKDDD